MLGEKREQDAFRSGFITAAIGVLIVTVMAIAVILNARWIASFLSNNEIVIRESTKYIYISMISEPFMAWGIILGGRGGRKRRFPHSCAVRAARPV